MSGKIAIAIVMNKMARLISRLVLRVGVSLPSEEFVMNLV